MASQLLLDNKGFRTAEWFIPPFVLQERELVVLNLKDPVNAMAVQNPVVDIVTGKTKCTEVNVRHPLTYVPHFRQSWFRRRFNPVSVGEYVKKNIGPASEYAGIIYEYCDVCEQQGNIDRHTQMDRLMGGPKRLLTLCAALHRYRYIVYDMRAVGPEAVGFIHELVKRHVSRGGAALLLDRYEELKQDCSRYVEVEWDRRLITTLSSPQ
ncbi:hypothetical protein HGH92_03150 [Chitinophaga varians]|uniref:Uncharacterized protein n=1 Tax=Chitinophaga varians TaxID=2202339 RepID=A0A847RJN4_9BACT|nr:hypothetical protein [Chitinophaga varians]NLR63293.1 hypothetical protein [Chitinophaga varians]